MQTQIVALSIDDMPLIEAAPIRPGERLGPCLLVVDGRYLLGAWDGECWADTDYARVYPERWLLLVA